MHLYNLNASYNYLKRKPSQLELIAQFFMSEGNTTKAKMLSVRKMASGLEERSVLMMSASVDSPFLFALPGSSGPEDFQELLR